MFMISVNNINQKHNGEAFTEMYFIILYVMSATAFVRDSRNISRKRNESRIARRLLF